MKELALGLKALPAQVLDHKYSYESFGSWSLLFRYKGRPFRIVFDGKEEKCALERGVGRKAPYDWQCTLWEKNCATFDLLSVADLIAVVRDEGAQ